MNPIILLTPDRYKQLDETIGTIDTTGLDYQQIATLLNAPITTSNPTPQGTIKTGSAATAIATLMAAPGGISADDLACVQAANTEFQALKSMAEALGQPSAIGTADYLQILQSKPLSIAAQTVLAQELAKTEPDSNWAPTIELPSSFQPPATSEDVQAYFADRDTYAALAVTEE